MLRRAVGHSLKAVAAAASLALPLVAAAQSLSAPPAFAEPVEQSLRVAVGPEPGGSAVTLDATVITPGDAARHPAVLMTHGFGGTKNDALPRARELAAAGYVVLAYSARGFGESGGRIHLADPAYEGADSRTLLDTLARRPDVQLDAPGDPRVGVAGASYGGALALMAAGSDRRVDASAASITWNDLADAFSPGRLPTSAVTESGAGGVFKRRWASLFFSRAVAADRTRPGSDPLCGRFDPQVCRVFLDAAAAGTPSPRMLAMLRAHSPAAAVTTLRAPTLLVQGMRDSLFGLDQADATARTLQRRGTAVAVRWFDGGHDGGGDGDESADLRAWFDRYLTDPGRTRTGLPVPAFRAQVPAGAATRTVSTPAYPGLAGVDGAHASSTLTDASAPRAILSPPGGDPAAITGLSAALGGAAGRALGNSGSGNGGGNSGQGSNSGDSPLGYSLAALPGQSAAFDTAALPDPLQVVGAPSVRLRVTSTARDATLFVSLWRLGDAGPSSPRAQVVPVRVSTTPGTPVDVTVPLPAGTYAPAAGSLWRVLVSATDAGYAVPTDARSYHVALADDALMWPTAPASAASDGGVAAAGFDPEVLGVSIALAALLAAVAAWAAATSWRRRRAHPRLDAATGPPGVAAPATVGPPGDAPLTAAPLASVPLVVDGLVKAYRDGHRAVDGVSWRADAGQVVGLLGPNGAGKTTTMRMLVGLIRPDSGSVRVLGEPVEAGSPVLARVGALIEGPGFLPHLTGRANLHAYWAATGRDPAEADIDAALDVAALGDAIDRPVRTYSQGMRQRLGIAQAMLGRPEVLLLDEPTNGLDPPQIAAMRPILRGYAATGRTVVVSSHLLSEVEQTCTHVVVMNRGRVVTTGAVADLVAGDESTVVVLSPGGDVDAVAAQVRADLGDGVDTVRVDHVAGSLTLRGPAGRGHFVAAVVAAGGDVVSVSGRRRLEEVFLGAIGAEGTPSEEGDGANESEDARVERLRRVRQR